MLEISLLGKFVIKYDGEPVVISSRAAQSLFAYLILTAGTLHRREKLAGMFWADTNEEKARAYLRHELWLLRKALPTKSKFNYLNADDISISFNSSAEYWLDVAGFTNIGKSASIEELKDALSVFQGELLPGFYDDWVTQEREHLQAVYEQKMAQLLELLEKDKRWTDILEWAERWISIGEKPEAAYRYLMIAYDAVGDRAKVSSTYQRCVQALHELDLEPSEQTRALAFKRTSKLHIPIPLTSFIGREKELKEVTGLFSISRLITLTGSGGVGKTRLAIQVVAEVLDKFPDGVWFLDLAPLSDPALVLSTLMNLLGTSEPSDAKLPFTDSLINFFRSRTSLIIFDNCEHLIEPCAHLINLLLTSCRNMSILATSREALRVSGEVPYRVPSLEIPKPDIQTPIDELSNIESVRLFTERAAVTLSRFEISQQNTLAIAKICQRLDGIPLALELAAAQLRMLPVEQVAARLDNAFRILTNGNRTALPRHQTLQALIDWSYELLTPAEQIVFHRLAVFAGGWTLEAAETVCIGEGVTSDEVFELLAHLLDKSLVLVQEQNKTVRYRMLEAIRQYTLMKLVASGKAEAARQKHAAYYLAQAKLSEEMFHDTNFKKMWFDRVETEHDNMRAALAWSHSVEGDAELELDLASALGDFWVGRAYWEEGRGWLESALAHADVERVANLQLRAQALSALGTICAAQGDYEAAEKYFADSLKLYQELGGASICAFVLSQMGWLARERGDTTTARIRLEESLAIVRGLGNKGQIAYALMNLGEVLVMQEDAEGATRFLDESLSLCRELGDSNSIGWALNHLGHVAQIQEDYQRATRLHEESLLMFRESWQGLVCIPWVYQGLGEIALAQGDAMLAATHLTESLSLFHNLRDRTGVSWCLAGLAGVAALNEEPERAAWLWSAAEALRQSIGTRQAPATRATRERLQAEVRKQLGEDVFNAKWTEGQAASWEQTVKTVLSTRA